MSLSRGYSSKSYKAQTGIGVMADYLSTARRSAVMRSVKSKNTALECAVRSKLHHRGLRYRLNYPLPGKPDMVFVRARVAVFVDSCFWHGCPKHVRMPQANQSYWNHKIQRNIKRDAEVNSAYEQTEWKVLRLWEHEIKEDLNGCADRIEKIVRRRNAESAKIM